jgi:hypothetical protein
MRALLFGIFCHLSQAEYKASIAKGIVLAIRAYSV